MKFLCLIVLLFSLWGCEKKNDGVLPQPKQGSEQASTNHGSQQALEKVHYFGSVTTIEDQYVPLLHTNVMVKTSDQSLVDAMEFQLEGYHALFDQFNYYYESNSQGSGPVVKNLKVVNDCWKVGEPVEVDPRLTQLLEESLELMAVTQGYFNIFINPLLDAYEGKFSAFPIENTDPSPAQIEAALEAVLPLESVEAHLHLDSAKGTIEFLSWAPDENRSINLGAVAKGYIAGQLQKAFPDQKYLLNLGSSTIVANGGNYRIGLSSPHHRNLPLLRIGLPSGMSLSTSSSSQNYYILADDSQTIRCHLLDPFTGYSKDCYWSVTVISSNPMVADALSTALYNVEDRGLAMTIIEDAREVFQCSVEVCFVQNLSATILPPEDSASSPTTGKLGLLMTEGFASYVEGTDTGMGIESIEILENQLL
ncbi:MAG: FAD:protein FMN transferase [Spirochaetaceae bacterium]|nr:FAD:protein FMN transferase [Spirochaetaceae bacterium]